ncbi:MAG: lamin tail domain-containing protein [Planctomycetota bacterium]|nr:MAG: lamin tail domain-containing protein [Planctomycetota bacterium]
MVQLQHARAMSLTSAQKNERSLLCAENLPTLISCVVLLLGLTARVANATYTDYIGAGHDAGVTVTACSVDETATGQKTVDGSGLSGATHSTIWDDGWLAYQGASNPNPARSSYTYWIRYDFGEPYNLADMWVWNSNGDVGEDYTNRGLRNVYIDHSLNGSTWTALTSTEFSQATNSSSYPGFAGPDFGGATARYVLISAVDNWGATDGFYGLAEVKFNVGGAAGPNNVGILGSWTEGTTHTAEAGSNRCLIFTAHTEDNDADMDITSVSYGGQSMTEIIERNQGTGYRAYVGAFVLTDSGISAASGSSFSVTWAGSPSKTPAYSSVFLENVYQASPIGPTDSNGAGGQSVISTSPLGTSSGDMVIVAGTSIGTGTYDTLNGFTGLELSPQHADGVCGYKSATGANETPSIQHSTTNTQSIIGFVVRGIDSGPPDTNAPTPDPLTWSSVPSAITHSSITMTATTATDLAGVEYYFDETSGNPGATNSGWQPSPDYIDGGLSPETQYTYRVKARDLSPNHNETSWSSSESETTLEPVMTCPPGDLTGDCDVDIWDLRLFAMQWVDDPGCVGHPIDCADLDQQDDGIGFDDYGVLADDWQTEGLTLLINEFMASNDSNKADPQGEYDDWIEIYNPTGVTIDMAGMYLEDSGNSWRIPDNRPAETTISPGGYLLIWADNDVCDTPGLHAGFALSANGDEIRLYADDGLTLIDSISFEDMFTDISHGRYPDGIDNWFNMTGTPGSTNTIGMAGAVWFSHPEGTFTTAFSLGLTTESSTADIYYTLDNSEPTNGKTLYTGPFTISSTTWVRARAYESGLVAGPIVSKPYIKIDSDLQNFYSNLPIVIVESFGQNIDDLDWSHHPMLLVTIDTDEITGQAAITDPADYAGYGGIHLRGGSSAGEDYRKKQYKFETWDDNRPDPQPGAQHLDDNVSLLGLPAESDWILHAPWSDKTLMRNYQMYTWSNMIGRYASRTVFVELFFDIDDDGQVSWDTGLDGSATDYRGVYILMEKIKRDNDRVDIERLTPADVCEPEITGGYLLKKDHESADQDPILSFPTATYNDWLIYVEPEANEMSTAQKTWIKNHFDAFEAVLAGGSFDDPVTGYAQYIDVLSFLDHHILVELAKNVDGLVVSTYLFKDRLGKINMGPIWDYNGSLGGADYVCDWVPSGWLHDADDADCCPTETCCMQDGAWPLDNPNGYAWYLRLFQDPEFLLRYADRWFDLREDLFTTANMLTDINDIVNLLTDINDVNNNPVNRNFARWDTLDFDLWPNYYDNCNTSGNTYMDYVDWMKSWLTSRLTWMDSAIDANYGDTPPVINLNGSPADLGGYANVGDSVTITGGTIYYTLDGNDPRLHGGGIYGTLYGSPISLNGTKQVKARIKSGSDWSALNEAIFEVTSAKNNLRITEIMYHPPDANDGSDPNTEFIELKNIGTQTISLNLVSFTDGVDFTFPDMNLASGDYVVVVEDQNAFSSRYPSFSGTIAGEYTGKVSNAGERLELCDALGQTILNFRFKDGWYVITDGNDFSLNIIDPCDPDANNWEYSEYWQPSSVAGGTPGADDTGHFAAPGAIVINEVLSHTDDLVYGDWIELYNTTDSNISIAGWFLSDDRDNLKKYEIQGSDPRATVDANGYVVFNAEDDFRDSNDPGSNFQFGLSELGEAVYLSSGSGGNLTGGYSIREDFKAAENDVTFGRYTKSAATANDVDFVAMASATKGYANSGPDVGPVVVSEIMYHPATNGYAEYVELRNTTGSTVPLYDVSNPNNTWLFTDEDGGIEYYLPLGRSIPANGYMLLVKHSVAFNAEFTPAGGIEILEWASGRLSNAGEKVELLKPGDPEPDTGFVPYIRVDRVNYSDGGHPENFHELGADPWPTDADGGGKSLTRINTSLYGNDVANWDANTPTPGN